MGRQKGQGIVEYALILAFVVGIGGVLFANGNLADSIRSVFSNVNTLIEEASKQPLKAATTAEDIIDRLGEGRYKNLADLLQGKPSSGKKIIASDSEEGKELARKLNIQTKEGDGWFADIVSNGTLVVIYYSADANKNRTGKTYSELKKDFTDHPENYKTPVRVEINEAIYNSRGDLLHDYRNITTAGHVEPVSMGNEFSIYPGIH